MTSVSVRTQLALVFVALNIVAVGVLASLAYRASQESLTRQALATSRLVAAGREQALTRTLDRQRDRILAFLTGADRLCGEHNPSGRIAFERECLAVALRGFREAERALAVELRNEGRRQAGSGRWPADAVVPPPGQLVALTRSVEGTLYTMEASRGRLAVRVAYPLTELAANLSDRSGLQSRGHVLLTDARGQVLVATHEHADAAEIPGLAQPLRQCLAGESGDMIVAPPNEDGVIAGFEPVPAIGGGCMMASLDYSESLAPIARLRRLFLLGASGFIALAAIVSLILARTVTKPISRLATAAGQLEAGRFDQPIPLSGPSEVRQLGRALSRMAQSIGELVQREHHARMEAEAANRTKDDFLATLSHELRTPLTAILGWISILRDPRHDPARTDHALRVIERSARTEARLIEDLLDVTRIINGQLRLKLSELTLASVVDAALEAVRPAAEMKGVLLVKHVEGTLGTIVGDPHRLQQVVWNLLANAVRFTPRGGRIDVTLRVVDGSTELQVADTGSGIAPDLLPHVFERFRQGQTGAMRTPGGLGLGLAIVRHIAELHGGTVRAESGGPDRGATFTVTLPPPRPGLVTRPTIVEAPRAVDLQGARIVVVDDDPDAREVVRTILEQAGASVTTSASAAEMRSLIDRLHPDLLIADVAMPDEDGYAMIRALREQEAGKPGLPAIALTAHARAEDVELALKSGFQIHVAKPVDSARLVSSVATLIRPAA